MVQSVPDPLADHLAQQEAKRTAHRGLPAQNESIERRISEEVTAAALARKLAREQYSLQDFGGKPDAISRGTRLTKLPV